jgi:salicylate hydroxylase
MRKLAALVEPASSCIQIRNHYDLESWVSESGRVLALGEAANPFPVGVNLYLVITSNLESISLVHCMHIPLPLRIAPSSGKSSHTHAAGTEFQNFYMLFKNTGTYHSTDTSYRYLSIHREPRRARIREIEKQYIVAITLPDGEMQEGRDAAMRANQAVGRNALDAPESDLGEMYDDMRMM